MLIAVVIFGVLIFLLYGVHLFLLDKRYRLPPGPPVLPFIGSALSLRHSKKPWIAFCDLAKKYGPIITIYTGQVRNIVLCNPSTINEAIVSKGKSFSDRPSAFQPAFKDLPTGVLFANGEKWSSRRRFSLKALRDFGMGKIGIVNSIHDEVRCFLDEISSRTGQPFFPQRLLSNTVSNVICSLVFGKRFNYDDAEFIAFLDNMQRIITRPFSRRLLLSSLPFLRYFMKSQTAKDAVEMQHRVSKMLKQIVDEHRKDFSNENIRDFPDLFIQAELTDEGISFDEFALVMVDMFGAGTETTATSLNWMLLYLSTYPEIQKRCQEAIDNVIDTDRLPTLDDRPKLVYLDAVMCEIFRHATILPLSILHCHMGEKVTVSGYEVPGKSVVIYNIWALHHDETYWKEPSRFNPDRFIDANGKLLSHSTHFMPFGVGPRICLGELLARVEFFIFAVALLQRFKFSLADGNVSLDDSIAGITHLPPNYRVIATSR